MVLVILWVVTRFYVLAEAAFHPLVRRRMHDKWFQHVWSQLRGHVELWEILTTFIRFLSLFEHCFLFPTVPELQLLHFVFICTESQDSPTFHCHSCAHNLTFNVVFQSGEVLGSEWASSTLEREWVCVLTLFLGSYLQRSPEWFHIGLCNHTAADGALMKSF